jgi:hypothetical protein
MIAGYNKSFEFTEEVDSCGQSSGGCNLLEVEIVDAGGGPYLVIKTERWAIEDPEELRAMLAHCLEQYKETQEKYPEYEQESLQSEKAEKDPQGR